MLGVGAGRVFQIKMLSWNVWGLGGWRRGGKCGCWWGEKRSHIIFLQEAKLTIYDDSVCSSLWGNTNHAFPFHSSVGASRGLLTV